MYIMDFGKKKKNLQYLTLLLLLQKCSNTYMDFYVRPFNNCMTTTEKLIFFFKNTVKQ